MNLRQTAHNRQMRSLGNEILIVQQLTNPRTQLLESRSRRRRHKQPNNTPLVLLLPRQRPNNVATRLLDPESLTDQTQKPQRLFLHGRFRVSIGSVSLEKLWIVFSRSSMAIWWVSRLVNFDRDVKILCLSSTIARCDDREEDLDVDVLDG
ncbi:hypothetical protein Dsin_013009 [Dipteronia sinensis]|uniref:Uncharacterized protein n=1 Tax=Dipteronia sinensis TaxID=43782 RepID=A0AAE0E8P9_9ROSI|nr:hypothetical protein Dsin_013009 [Dipteronia sinensis]